MFYSVLIANRGEIACRIILTARRLGIETIAVYSDADRQARHVELADQAWHIGPSDAAQSYLDMEKIMHVARRSKAACIHPGYGFLSESAVFARLCAHHDIRFIGPPVRAMELMGRKDKAKQAMARAGIPTVPGFAGKLPAGAKLADKIQALGLPVMIKAVAGGGGKGMRRVDQVQDIGEAIDGARREALASFGDDELLVEKLIERPRHIEVQIFADQSGNVVHMFERDCSAQRRHQKVIEEAPAPGISKTLREKLCQSAVRAAKAAGYEGAGTIEFLVENDASGEGAPFYFLEMNTRLQVEHPITEQITGLDLVEWQFRIAAGEQLPRTQETIRCEGHAVEARLYAEDPQNGFLPSGGRIHKLAFSDKEVRIETGVREGDTIPPHYDPMIAKLIALGKTRSQAIKRLAAALNELIIAGPKTNAAFLYTLLKHQDFAAGAIDTGWIERSLDNLVSARSDLNIVLAGALALMQRRQALICPPVCQETTNVCLPSPYENTGSYSASFTVIVNGQPHQMIFNFGPHGKLSVQATGTGQARTVAAIAKNITIVETGQSLLVLHKMQQLEVSWPDFTSGEESDLSEGVIRSPLHGHIAKLEVEKGSKVSRGDILVTIEAMKMEHRLSAPFDGIVSGLFCSEGEQVGEEMSIMEIEAVTGEI